MLNNAYENLLKEILEIGELKTDRTGTGTLSKFGCRLEYDLTKGYPLITTKRVAFKSMITELLWMLRGNTNIKWLQENGCTIWDEWADERGELGPVYGKQWRSWEGNDNRFHDQISDLIVSLRDNPDSRRHIVNAWNVGEIQRMALPPCHMMFQCYVREGKFLDLQIYQRSADMFLGVPFNIASYAALVHILSVYTRTQPGRLIWVGGDCHIYSNHVEQVREQLSREVRDFPDFSVGFFGNTPFWEVSPEMFSIFGYNPHPAIKAPVAV